MFEPKVTLTLPILNKLGMIERLYGQLLGEKLIPSLTLRLSQENLILATHHSTSIEGNPLSPQDVTNVILGDQLPTTKSEKEVKNYFGVLNTLYVLLLKHEDLSVGLVEKLHKQLMEGIEKKDYGEVRNGPVFVGHKTKTEIVVKHNPPYHTDHEIKKAPSELFIWATKDDEYHPLLKAAILHHQFAYIHPFFDGNGRLARILTAYYLLLKQYEVTKYFILDDYYDIDRNLYSDTLHTADTGNVSSWIEYFLDGIANSLQAALARIQELKQTNMEEFTGEKRVLVTPREEEVIQIAMDKKAIKSSDLEDAFSVTRQQAHQLLSSLVKKGLMEKFGKTKTSYYKLLKQES